MKQLDSQAHASNPMGEYVRRMKQLDPQAHASNPMDEFRPRAELFVPPTNRDDSYGWGKPMSRTAFWTSTEATLLDDGWVGWCRKERYDNPAGYWRLVPRPVRVFEVHDGRDVLALHREYGTVAPHPSFRDKWSGLDWTAIAHDFDAVRCADPYHEEVRFNKLTSSFYGWDCESTCWLVWAFDDELTTYVELPPYEYPCWDCFDEPCTCEKDA